MKTLSEHLNERRNIKFKKDKYKIYLSSWSETLEEISDYVKKNGYSYDSDEFFNLFGDAYNKPKSGKTYKAQLPIYLDDKEVSILNIQIYNRGQEGNPFELNMYLS